jgi:hypothetical protein
MTTTRNWRAHALAPTSGADLIRDALRLAGRYYNALVEIERDRAARFAALRRDLAPELAALEDEAERLDQRAEDLVHAIKRSRQAHWRAAGEASLAVPPDLEAALVQIRAELKRVSGEAKPLRKAFAARLAPDQARYKATTTERAGGGGPRIKSRVNAKVLAEMLADDATDLAWRRVAQSDDVAHAAARAARAECGLLPGTYLLVEEAVARAKKDSAPRPPRFRAHRGMGRVGVQLRSATFGDLLTGASSQLRITPAPRKESTRSKRDCEYFHAQLRVGSDGRTPVWATIPIRLHRQPPQDAAVKWAWLLLRRQGERVCYELQLVLQHESFAEPKRPPGVGDGGHVRLGWAQVEAGVRVALWDGGELVVPQSTLRRVERADMLRSHADVHFDRLKRALRLWQHGSGNSVRWDRLCSERARLHLRSLLVRYAEHELGDVRELWRAWRQSAPQDLFPSLAEADRWLRSRRPGASQGARLAWWCYLWARKDQHLRQWEADARRGFEHARDALFRSTAIRLGTQHEMITVDRYSVAQLKERPRPLTLPGEAPNEVAQRNAQLAAPGRFREILLEVMGPRCTPCERSGDAATAEGARKGQKRKGSRGVAGAPDGASEVATERAAE